jgi:hypothetical protein
MELFDSLVNKDESFTGELWRKRAQALITACNTTYATQYGIAQITDKSKKKTALAGRVLAMMNALRAMGFEVNKITREALKPQYVIIHGFEQISDLGIDAKMPVLNRFKKLLYTAPENRVFFIISTSTLEDASVLRTCLNHGLMDNLTMQMQGHLKIGDFYPENCAPYLGIYYNSTLESDRCRKFKKMLYKGEIL